MSSKVGRPRDGDSAETRRKILRAARVRFAQDGFRATTNRMIAQDAGITSGAIYHYVESKAELYADVYCSTVDHLYSEFERAAAEHETLFDQYGAVLRRAAELSLDDPSITGFIVAVTEETRRHPDLLALMKPQRGRHARFFAGLVEAAHERGELAPDLDLRALTDLLGSVMTGLARMSHAAGDAARYTAAVEVLERFLDGSLLNTRV